MHEQIDYAKAVADFRELITLRKSSSGQPVAKNARTIPQSNRYRTKGQAYQERRGIGDSSKSLEKKRADAHYEKHIHEAIVRHPFLLHTPELYAGGLYLESLINKLPLHRGQETDFAYVTVQDRTIRVMLVEIEQAAWNVFDRDALGRVMLHSDTRKPLQQVIGWQRELSSDFGRAALLWKLQDLFTGFPFPIFSQGENPKPLVGLEIGYMLIMGNELPEAHEHQQLVDELYLDSNILFMTFPMMLAESERRLSARNVIKVGAYRLSLKSTQNPQALHPVFPVPDGDLLDPHGIKRYGLGHARTNRKDSVFKPLQLKKAFYRSQGYCEKEGCEASLFEGDAFIGELVPIYNQIGEKSKPNTYADLNNFALACPLHNGSFSFNDGHRRCLGEQHPLNDAMRHRRAYRAALDNASQDFMRRRIESIASSIVDALEIGPDHEPVLADGIHRCALAIRSLPSNSQVLLAKVLKDHYGTRHASRVDRSVDCANSRWDWFYLYSFGLVLVRYNPSAEKYKQMEPIIFSKSLMDRIEVLFGDRAFFAFGELCKASGTGLRNELKRVREARLRADI